MVNIVNVWKWVKVWWENRKEVIKGFVIPKLDLAVQPLADYLVSRGLSQQLANTAAKDAINWLKEYLQRQI